MRLKGLVSVFVLLSLIVGVAVAQDDAVTFTVTINNISGVAHYDNSGVSPIPLGAEEAGPALPGSGYEFDFTAEPGDYLSFVTMFVQSNDLFFAPDPAGIALYDADGNAVTGDVTDQVLLWDAGTEVNQEPGVGEDQAPRQAGPNTGASENGVVRLVDDGYEYPATADVIQVTLSGGEDGNFTARIDNISENASLPTPITPIVWAVHGDMMEMMGEGSGVFFTTGQPDNGHGLESVAEDGNPMYLAAFLAGSNVATPITPIVWVVTDAMDNGAFFTVGEADRDLGLESVAEDGNPAELAGNLEGMDYAGTGVSPIPFGAEEAGPALPGSGYEFTVTAVPGQTLSFVTMFVQSNDWFFGPGEAGIPLFNEDGTPFNGYATKYVELWDAGTEVDEPVGEGENQAPRQAGPNTGDDENGVVDLVSAKGFEHDPVISLIEVTIHPDDMMGE